MICCLVWNFMSLCYNNKNWNDMRPYFHDCCCYGLTVNSNITSIWSGCCLDFSLSYCCFYQLIISSFSHYSYSVVFILLTLHIIKRSCSFFDLMVTKSYSFLYNFNWLASDKGCSLIPALVILHMCFIIFCLLFASPQWWLHILLAILLFYTRFIVWVPSSFS